MGFSAEHAPYYAVVRFDKLPKLKKGKQTNVADIQPISEFISME